jgi:FkbM family methyltransferase
MNAHISRLLSLYKTATASSATAFVARRAARRLGWTSAQLQRLKLRHNRGHVFVREGGSSDYDVIRQIFVGEQLKPACAVREPGVIVDCGANVGYASVYLLERFPNARVIAVEPAPDNADVCAKNLAPYGARATLLQAAIWPHCAQLRLVRGEFGDGREWSTQVREVPGAEEATVRAVDIPSLMRQHGITHIDLLKVDIEGGEVPLFNDERCRDWLGHVSNIAIELHGDECEKAFFGALSDFDYTVVRSGELHICFDIRAKVVRQ